MIQEIKGRPVGVTQSGNVIVCQSADGCRLERDEAEQQRRFEENTGITCCKGARIALSHLLEVGQFDNKQLALAWRNGAIYWDYDAGALKARVSLVEKAYGAGLIILFGLMSATFALMLIIERPPLSLLQAIQYGLVIGMFFAVVPVAEKYMIRPNRIASRAKPHIQTHHAAVN